MKAKEKLQILWETHSENVSQEIVKSWKQEKLEVLVHLQLKFVFKLILVFLEKVVEWHLYNLRF